MKIYLFTSTRCPKCPEATEWANKNLKNYEYIIADETDDAMILCQKFGVRSVPTFVEEHTNGAFKSFTFREYRRKK